LRRCIPQTTESMVGTGDAILSGGREAALLRLKERLAEARPLDLRDLKVEGVRTPPVDGTCVLKRPHAMESP